MDAMRCNQRTRTKHPMVLENTRGGQEWARGDVRVKLTRGSSAPSPLKAAFLLGSLPHPLRRKVSCLYWTAAFVPTQKAGSLRLITVPCAWCEVTCVDQPLVPRVAAQPGLNP